jgi:hypothetical protein
MEPEIKGYHSSGICRRVTPQSVPEVSKEHVFISKGLEVRTSTALTVRQLRFVETLGTMYQ